MVVSSFVTQIPWIDVYGGGASLKKKRKKERISGSPSGTLMKRKVRVVPLREH